MNDVEDVVVETGQGALRGRFEDGVFNWRGVPFAAPPVGPLRFRAPQPHVPWDGVRDATEFGAACVQLPFFSDIDAPIRGAEDCLTLNIWSPKPDGKRRPVLFWIHGGGWVMNAGSRFDGTLMAARGDVVVVTVNYRLGPWGFLFLGDLDAEHFADCANPGLLDLVAGLRWVKDNIAGFGGDPDNVTVFGESAGGMLTGTLLATPAAEGLFHRAIAQSGAARNVRDRATGTRITTMILDQLGIPPAEAHRLDAVPMERLYRAAAMVLADSCVDWMDVEPFLPVIDGAVLPRHPTEAIADGAGRDVPLIVMTCRDEMTIMEPECPEVLFGKDAFIRRVLGEADYARITAAYEAASAAPRVAHMEFLTGVMFRVGAFRLAEAADKAGGNVWMAQVDYRLSLKPFRDVGPSHLSDVLMLFETHSDWGETVADQGTLVDKVMSDRLQQLVFDFARTGIAGAPTVGTWPRYNADTRSTLIFDTFSRIEDDPLSDQRRAWDGVRLH